MRAHIILTVTTHTATPTLTVSERSLRKQEDHLAVPFTFVTLRCGSPIVASVDVVTIHEGVTPAAARPLSRGAAVVEPALGLPRTV